MTQVTLSTKEPPATGRALSQQFPISYKIVERKEIGKARWDKFAEESPTAWLWHRYDYADIWSLFPGREDVSFGLVDSATSELAAIVPTYKIHDRIAKWIPWNSLDVFGGPAYLPLAPKKIKAVIIETLCEELRARASRHQAHEVKFSMAPMTPEIMGDECPLVNPLLDLGCYNTLGQTWVCDLRNSREDLLKKMGKGARSSINKAQKAGVQVRMASDKDLDAYYRIHCETYHRTGTPPQPREFFEGIWKYFLNTGLSAIFVAEQQGEVIAAANVAVYKRGAYYWTGASNAAGLSTGSGALLQWAAIQWMVDEKLEWYEVGEALPKSESGKRKRLSDFKKDFGGSLYPFFRGTLDTKNKFGKTVALLKDFRSQIFR